MKSVLIDAFTHYVSQLDTHGSTAPAKPWRYPGYIFVQFLKADKCSAQRYYVYFLQNGVRSNIPLHTAGSYWLVLCIFITNYRSISCILRTYNSWSEVVHWSGCYCKTSADQKFALISTIQSIQKPITTLPSLYFALISICSFFPSQEGKEDDSELEVLIKQLNKCSDK